MSKELSELSAFKLLSVIKEMKFEDNWLFFVKNCAIESFVNLGTYTEAVSVSSNGLTASAQVTILDAPLAGVRIQPENAQVRVGQEWIRSRYGKYAWNHLEVPRHLYGSNSG